MENILYPYTLYNIIWTAEHLRTDLVVRPLPKSGWTCIGDTSYERHTFGADKVIPGQDHEQGRKHMSDVGKVSP